MEQTELRAIPFVQLIGGEKRAVKFMTSPEIAAKALHTIEAGYQFRVANYGDELYMTIICVATDQEVAVVVLDNLSTPHALSNAVRALVEGFTPEPSAENYHGA